ncbi:hypothetical protein B7P43_G17515 [Cryptotermes secundus]|uniref:Centrosomal protein of 78 kDa n=1 Tax=Cryptotermes secundus TaxID=105785 RepID=A0A2J7R055_9NEOP|nr:centrosomal protein of 78 kDa isoform X2 [Cryptotermes secundus]PNF34217.1 hypothetical protein B7P43_G17515 [Cryptotermes secundus]
MLPSVKERKKNANKFHLCYEEVCKVQNVMPLPAVMAHRKKSVLCLSGDRLAYREWGPILHALSQDRSLQFIGVRSKAVEPRAGTVERVPSLQTRRVLLPLMKAIQTCMNHTEALTSVELEALPLGSDLLCNFIQGIKSCRPLQNVSLHRSPIRDEGCRLICRAIKGLTNIKCVDLSGCGITARGAMAVAEMLKYQKIQRYSETWKQTLRGCDPDVDSLPGLRRVTLNHNTDIGDDGAVHLVNAVRDDIFVKALDLQNCGVGNTGGKAALEMLQLNVSLAVMDLRANKNINSELLTQIMRRLYMNNHGASQKYHWIAVSCHQLPRQPLRPKLCIHPKLQPLLKNTSSLKLDLLATEPSKRRKVSVLTKGVPWRVSVRLDKRRECAENSPGVPRMVQHLEPEPPYHMQALPPTPPCLELTKAKRQLLWMSEQLNMETAKCRQLEEKNMILRHHLEDFLGHNRVLVEKQTVALIQQCFSDFQNFILKLRNAGFSDLVDADVQNPDTDHEGHLAFHIRKSYNSPAACDKCIQTDLQIVGKSAAMFKDWPVQPAEMHVEDSASVGDCLDLADSETNQRSSTQEENAANTKHDSRRKDMGRVHKKDLGDANYILYQTVLQKNKELDRVGLQFSKPDVNITSKSKSFKGDMLVAPADTVLCRGGFSISSGS